MRSWVALQIMPSTTMDSLSSGCTNAQRKVRILCDPPVERDCGVSQRQELSLSATVS
jgi:hypothetical protein